MQDQIQQISQQDQNKDFLISLYDIHGYVPRKGKCGYCNNTSSYYRCGFSVKNKMKIPIYESLVDRGWTRSGSYFYKPSMDMSCCRSYVMRMSPKKFIYNKKQRKIFQKFDQLIQLSKSEFQLTYDAHAKKYQNQDEKIPSNEKKTVITTTETNFGNGLIMKRGNLVVQARKATFDDITPQCYERFLCMPVLGYELKKSFLNNINLPIGSVHFDYYLHGKLIAVAVADITENFYHSMYFFYDTNLASYSLGVVSILFEIEYVKYMSQFFPSFTTYNMGYYIDTPKMMYKIQYGPSQILCPVTYKYIDYQKIKEQIKDKNCNLQLNECDDFPIENHLTDEDLIQFLDDECVFNILGEQIYMEQINPEIRVNIEQELIVLMRAMGIETFNNLEFGVTK